MKQCHQLNFISSQWGWLSYLSEDITDRNNDGTLLFVTFLREILRKCIGNCSKAKVLCKQFRTRWRASCSISFEKGKIMERFNCKELLKKRWRDPRDDPYLMHKPAEKLPWLKEIGMIPDASFVSSVLVRSTFVKGSLAWISVYKFKYNGRKRTSMQLRHIILI